MKKKISYIYNNRGNFSNNSSIENVLINLKKSLNKNFSINLINEKNFLKNINYFLKSKIIHLHGCWNFIHILCFFFGIILGKKIFFSPHGMLDPESLKIKSLKKKIAWKLYQKFICSNSDIICNSVLEKNNLKKLNLNKNIVAINHGIDFHHNHFIKTFSKPKFISFSRIHPIKNIFELILIWKSSTYLKNFNLDIYGEIDDFNYFYKIKELIKEDNNINYKFPLNNKNKFNILSEYNVYLFPSKTENFGITVLEAMSCGLYIIANRKLPWKIIEEEKFGKLIFFNKVNLEKSIRQIVRSFKNKKFIKKKKIHFFLKKNYSWRKIAIIYSNFYNKSFMF
jgi:glycosyltransferase involved in cell wall biosynthesis